MGLKGAISWVRDIKKRHELSRFQNGLRKPRKMSLLSRLWFGLGRPRNRDFTEPTSLLSLTLIQWRVPELLMIAATSLHIRNDSTTPSCSKPVSSTRSINAFYGTNLTKSSWLVLSFTARYQHPRTKSFRLVFLR